MKVLEFRECLKSLLFIYKTKYDYKEPIEDKENQNSDNTQMQKMIKLTKVFPKRVTSVLSSMPSFKVNTSF